MVRGGSKAIEGADEERRRNLKRKNAAALLSLAAALMLLLAERNVRPDADKRIIQYG